MVVSERLGPVEHCLDVHGDLLRQESAVSIRPIGNDLDEPLRLYLQEILPAVRA